MKMVNGSWRRKKGLTMANEWKVKFTDDDEDGI